VVSAHLLPERPTSREDATKDRTLLVVVEAPERRVARGVASGLPEVELSRDAERQEKRRGARQQSCLSIPAV
jgi:hypothetical protein